MTEVDCTNKSVALAQDLKQLLQLRIFRPNPKDLSLQKAVRTLNVQKVVNSPIPLLFLQLELHMISNVNLFVVATELVHKDDQHSHIILSCQEKRSLAFGSGPLFIDQVVNVKYSERYRFLNSSDGLVLLLQHL